MKIEEVIEHCKKKVKYRDKYPLYIIKFETEAILALVEAVQQLEQRVDTLIKFTAELNKEKVQLEERLDRLEKLNVDPRILGQQKGGGK